MGIIRRQGVQSTILIYLGFLLGAANILILFPKCLDKEEAGLVFLFVAISKIILGFATLGTIPLMNKFFPYYKSNLSKKENDFLPVSFILPMLGFLLTGLTLIIFKDFFIRKSIEKSPLFTEYYWWIIPFSFFYIVYSIFETYSGTYYKTIVPAILREIGVRLITTVLVAFLFLQFLNFDQFVGAYSMMFSVLALGLAFYLKRIGNLFGSLSFSKVTRRLKNHIFAYGSYIYGGVIIGVLADNADVLIVGGLEGLGNVAVYQTGHYVATMIHVPLRSLSTIAVPVLSQAWRDKDFKLIGRIYEKSSINLLLCSLFIFGLIWTNVDVLTQFLGPDYKNVQTVILLLGLARIVELGFGLNSEILNTSTYWKYNFISYVILVLLFLPLNYYFVKHFGMIGAAVANVLAFLAFNITRFVFIWIKAGLQPFTRRSLLALLIFAVALGPSHFIEFSNPILEVLVSSFCFATVFALPAIYLEISTDVNMLLAQSINRFFHRS